MHGSILSVVTVGRQKCRPTVSADSMGQRVVLCVAGLTDSSHPVTLLSVVWLLVAAVINISLLLVLFIQIIQKQVEKDKFLGNAEVPNAEKNENFGKYSKFPGIPSDWRGN